MHTFTDIDLDFPRDIREETIKRIHDKYGWERSVLTGAIATYKIRGCIPQFIEDHKDEWNSKELVDIDSY